jgi:flavin reductase (DIM6/NTAB) family NADH-FMN oxidoreductase RutF
MAADIQPGEVFDPKRFWQAIGQRALGVSVVTATGPDGPAGFLGLSSAHVSADPPLMLVSVDKRTSALATILQSRHFALNYLSREQQAIADLFGGKAGVSGAQRFDGAIWETLATGAPVLADAAGAIDCRLEQTLDVGGVTIVIGRVADARVSNRDPLVFFRGRYATTQPL